MNKKYFKPVFIALGSNLKNPVSQIQQAFNALAKLPGTHLVKCSSLYKSSPIGKIDQPDFINAVAQIETSLQPHDLLTALLDIEHQHGRIRKSLNAPRTLDLDILLYENQQYCDEELTIPHPRMTQRAFVLQPLLEIAPDCYIPGYDDINKLLTACSEQQLERIKTS
ncbi:MAG: 2-amino-4-hydroxy-6-hydroxymethyldihydropteridine diphosphokinase [Nitrosomonas sp.]|nr:2-amino-4-hydroxy-6-hydroxymethyldihydropteridine diphosphokinase [Nitrosomonas sp.]